MGWRDERIIRGYEEGDAEKDLPADHSTARSLVPAGTANLRDFSNVAPEVPIYIAEHCTWRERGPADYDLTFNIRFDRDPTRERHVVRVRGGRVVFAACEGEAARPSGPRRVGQGSVIDTAP